MPDAFFEPLGGGRYAGSPHTAGPWSHEFMHAGPPTALLAHGSAQLVDAGRLRLGRICVEILSPVPVGEVQVEAAIVRPGSSVALVESRLSAAGRDIMLARCWYLRCDDAVDVPSTPVAAAPPPGHPSDRPSGWLGGYLDAVEWRWVSGGFEEPGPGSVWARPRVALVAGHEASAEERLLMVADSASGVSAVASPRDLIFVNTDLTVHLLRRPQGEWLWLRAQTWLDANGSGVARGTLGDAQGELGATGQLLFVRPAVRPRSLPL